MHLPLNMKGVRHISICQISYHRITLIAISMLSRTCGS